MKLPRLFALLFALFAASTTKAEKPLMVESAWLVSNHDYLIDIASNIYGLDRRSLEFPDEIKSEAAWLGGTITDGNEIWTWMILQLKDDAPALTPPSKGFGEKFKGWGTNVLLKLKLRTNAFIDAAFPDGNFQMHKTDGGILLISTGFDEERGAVLLKNHFDNLDKWRDWYFVFMQYYPERTLLPTLPPEQEGEGSFINKVRQRSAQYYKEGQDTGTVASAFLGLRFEDHGCQFVWEVINIEESSSHSGTEPLPFQFGGFVNPDAAKGITFRVERELIETKHIGIKFGTTVIPPEEHKDETKHSFDLRVVIASSEPEEGEGYHLIKEESNIYVLYPKQTGDRPDEEGMLSNEELHKIHEQFAHIILETGDEFFQSLFSVNWSQPIDFIYLLEDDVIYIACTSPSSEFGFDWNLANRFLKSGIDYFQQIDSNFFDIGDLQMETVGEPTTVAGVTWHRMLLSEGFSVPMIVGYAPDKFYAAISSPIDGIDEVSDDLIKKRYETMSDRLVRKVNDSRQAVAEKMEPPTTLFHSKAEGHNYRLDYETFEWGFRFTFHAGADSFGNALSLIASYGSDFLKQALPFLND